MANKAAGRRVNEGTMPAIAPIVEEKQQRWNFDMSMLKFHQKPLYYGPEIP